MNYSARSLRLRIPRICVSVTGTDAAELLDKAESVLRENAFIELRLDHLKSPLAALSHLRQLIETRPAAIIIATCRRAAAGGKFHGPVEAQLDVLRKAAEAGCQAIDVEIESAEVIASAEWEELRARAAIVLSSHDFETTSRLQETFVRMRSFAADFYKLVGTATCLHDNVVMTRFLEQHSSEYSMVGMCMGEQGMLSRVLSIRAGAAFTFGSAGLGQETAPGQPSYRELRDFYRVEQMEPVTKVYGIGGNPVSHSMSPWVMNSAFRRENVNAVYLPLHAKTLEDLLSTVTSLPLNGISVTMPYKQGVVNHLDNSDVLTQSTGACNTIVRGKDGRLFGFNTDVYGIIAAIEARLPLQGARVLVLGAGGAARAAVFGFRAKGAEVSIFNRTSARAQELAQQSGSKTVKRSELPKLKFDVIFNATPVGMGLDKHIPLEESELNALWVFDSVYNPIDTGLLKLAQSKGCGTISGAEMFVHQAARQFEIWTGKPAPIDGIRQVLLRQLGALGVENSAPIPTMVLPKVKAGAESAIAAESSETDTPIKANSDAADGSKPGTKPVGNAATMKVTTKPLTRVAPAKAVSGKAATVKIDRVKTGLGKTGEVKSVKPSVKVAGKAAAAPSSKGIAAAKKPIKPKAAAKGGR